LKGGWASWRNIFGFLDRGTSGMFPTGASFSGSVDPLEAQGDYRLVTHFKFLIGGPDQKMVTKRL
jgi:hypothetical protein